MELIHTCYRIGDIDRSVAFYEALGFEERRRMPIRDEAINVFMGLPGDGDRLELTYNHGVDSYEMGTGYNHIALTVVGPRRDARGARREGHRPREAAVPGARGRVADLLRARSGRLPHRVDRARRDLIAAPSSAAEGASSLPGDLTAYIAVNSPATGPQVPGSSTSSPSAVSRPPSRRSQIMSQWTALSFVPPVSG